MKRTIAPQTTRRTLRAETLRSRSHFPALAPGARPLVPCTAENDFLVPNPRPDLTLDPQTLRMIEVG